jgi:sec-independent protein translocase protein TatA
MFGLGSTELLMILAIAFLIFGGKKMPEIGAGLGKAIGNFKRGLDEAQDMGVDLKKQIPGVRQVNEVKEKVDQVRNISEIISK